MSKTTKNYTSKDKTVKKGKKPVSKYQAGTAKSLKKGK